MKNTKPKVAHSRTPLTSRMECGLSEFELPPGHGMGWRHTVTCKDCLQKIASRRAPPRNVFQASAKRMANKALAEDHFQMKREVKQAQKVRAV